MARKGCNCCRFLDSNWCRFLTLCKLISQAGRTQLRSVAMDKMRDEERDPVPYTPNGPTPSFIEFADLNSVNRTQKSMNQNHLVHRVLIHRVLSQNSVNNNSVNEDQTLGRFVAPNLLAPNSMNVKLYEQSKLYKPRKTL